MGISSDPLHCVAGPLVKKRKQKKKGKKRDRKKSTGG